MPKPDLYHDVVRSALLKDQWVITDDPFYIEYRGARVYADLAAEQTLAAQKAQRKIVVEIKVFASPSPMTELERAVGQYGIYRTFLKRLSPERELFLAVAEDIYQDFFARPAIQDIIEDHAIRLLVFHPEREEIVQWIG
jgi:hypothetical protein